MQQLPFRVSAVLFDFDDTLTEPGSIDFLAIRRALGCPTDRSILEYIQELDDPAERERALTTLGRMEQEAAAGSRPNAAAEQVVRWLKSRALPVGILTRNGRDAICRALQNFPTLGAGDFQAVVTREDPAQPKPDPGGVLLAAERMGVPAGELLVVGNYVFDIEAGRRAGAVTVLLQHSDALDAGYAEGARANSRAGAAGGFAPGRRHPDGVLEPAPDFIITDLADLPRLVRSGLPLPAGKYPCELLEEYLDGLPNDDPSVVVGPHVGRDVCGVAVRPSTLLALGADPITFTTDALGHYAVVVNANDIAASGATPRWFLATVLMPQGSTPSHVQAVLHDLRDACRRRGVSLCGGHTEITDAVTRPVVSGMMIGTAGDRGLLDKRGMRSGDALLLTKRVAVEGTALLAGELGAELSEKGLTAAELLTCRNLLQQLSVVDEARIAADFDGVSAMHDVTEGGLATAIAELAAAGRHSLSVDLDAIPYYPPTRRLCEVLGLDPLGLMGSGSLLICCRSDQAAALRGALAAARVEAEVIGRVLGVDEAAAAPALETGALDTTASTGRRAAQAAAAVIALRGGRRVPWPVFKVDEVARALSGAAHRA